jgi:hypothetical protein
MVPIRCSQQRGYTAVTGVHIKFVICTGRVPTLTSFHRLSMVHGAAGFIRNYDLLRLCMLLMTSHSELNILA